MVGRTPCFWARTADDQLELGEFLDDGDDVFAELLGEDHGLDEFIILEAVADDRGPAAVHERQHGQKFRLAAGLQAEAEFLAELDDFFDHVPLLVHFHRVDAGIGALVGIFGDGVFEGFVNLPTRCFRISVNRTSTGRLIARMTSSSTSFFRSIDFLPVDPERPRRFRRRDPEVIPLCPSFGRYKCPPNPECPTAWYPSSDPSLSKPLSDLPNQQHHLTQLPPDCSKLLLHSFEKISIASNRKAGGRSGAGAPLPLAIRVPEPKSFKTFRNHLLRRKFKS